MFYEFPLQFPLEMESFPEQLKRHARYYQRLYDQALGYARRQAQLARAEQELADTLAEFASTEPGYARAPLAGLAELLLRHASTLGAQLPNIESCFRSFDCADEIQGLRRLAKEQRAAPGREIKAVFLRNAAIYQ